MQVTFPVQKASFRGIYEMIGGVFTPKSLDWFVLTDEEYESFVEFQFENTRGLTFMIVKHNCSQQWTFQMQAVKTIPDNPFDLGLVGMNVYIPLFGNQKQEIIGPFSGSFDVNGVASGLLMYNGNMEPNTKLFVAVVALPQGSM